MWRLPRTLYPPNRPAHLALPTPHAPPARCLLPPPQAAHADALAHYGALLQELHLGPDARWRDYAERVARDPQGRGSNPALGRGEAEDLFRQHVQGLYEAALEGYLDLLDAEVRVRWRAGGGCCAGWRAVLGRGPGGGAATAGALMEAGARAAGGRGEGPHGPRPAAAPHPAAPAASPAPQPLVPSRQQEEELGLPRPLLRWRDAEPLLEEDPRCARMPDGAR